MPIFYVRRTPYNFPSGRRIKKFRDASVLEWLQRIWDSGLSTEELLGGNFYGGFGHLLDCRAYEKLEAPKTNAQVVKLLRGHSYSTHVKQKSGNFEIETDDDEMDLSEYFFDLNFAEKNPNRVKFLLHDKWLPNRVGKFPRSRPATFFAARNPSQTCDSNFWDFFKIDGTRLGSIGNIVELIERSFGDCSELKKFLSLFDENTPWKKAIAKLVTSDLFANQLTQSKCSAHICQVNLHDRNWKVSSGVKSIFSQLIVYDDLWAKTYPQFVRSLKRMKHGDILFGKQPANTMR